VLGPTGAVLIYK